MISWGLFPLAINEYAKFGYTYIHVPWIIDEESTMATMPPQGKPFIVNSNGPLKYLAGSAEQSFLYLALRNELAPGKYMALTPCFRDDKEDDLHQKYFMKLELIDVSKNHYPSAIINMINDARYVLSQFSRKALVIQPTDDGSDLTLNGIEIGSYGRRAYKDINWIYGTGLAEPRFSIANQKSSELNYVRR